LGGAANRLWERFRRLALHSSEIEWPAASATRQSHCFYNLLRIAPLAAQDTLKATRMADSSLHLEGTLTTPANARFAIVSSRFNELIVERLAAGARDGLSRHGVSAAQISEVLVPGAREMTPILARLAKSGKFEAIIALGAVIRGGTPHFEYVAGEISRACGSISEQTGVPVIFGVLTTETIEQAIERAGTKAGNKGYDAALAAIKMVNLQCALTSAGI